jgi:molybdate transport system ATP-binding protein
MGKTTVLRCIAGLELPDRGVIRFQDELWFDSSRSVLAAPQSRRVGLLLQDYMLFPHLTVRQNVEYGIARDGNRHKIAEEMLRLFGVAELADRLPRQISGGQAQRVALARAAAPRPRILLLDEPLSALDLPSRARFRAELRRLLAAIELPTLLVTHDRTEAISLGHQIIVMAEGSVRQLGPVDEVFRRPADPAVAATVGVETILHGTITEADAGLVQVLVNQEVVSAVFADSMSRGEPVLVCIRAEEVTLQQETSLLESARNHFSGRIVAIESDGAVERVSVDCGFPLVAIITRKSREEMNLRIGSLVRASVKATAVHLIRL